MKNLQKYIFVILLFLIPTQLACHFWPSWSFVYGIRVDFLAPAVYLTDLLIVSLIFLNPSIYKKSWTLILATFLFAFFNTAFSTSLFVSAVKWIKIFEFLFFAIFIVEQKALKTKDIYIILFYSAVFFSLIGIFQFIKGGTLGFLYFLGERSFNSSTPGIALVNIFGRSFLRAYSTFPHPNAFAGYLGAVALMSLKYLRKNRFFYLGITILASGFVLTFSLSAFIGLLTVGILFLFYKNSSTLKKLSYGILCLAILVSLLLPVFSKEILTTYQNVSQNIFQRLELSFLAGSMISQRFFTGEGINTFIINIPRFKGIFSYSWLLQPVHNIFLLVISETGIVGLLFFCFLIFKLIEVNLRNKSVLVLVFIFILVTGFTDHYWLTLQQNLLMFSLLVGLSFRPDLS